MTNSQRRRASAVMRSSVRPSARYSCSGSPLMFVKGRTASEGRSSALAPAAAGGAGSASPVAGLSSISRSLRPVWLSTIASVRSEKSPVRSLSTVDLPSFVLKANCSREMRSRAR